MADIFSAIWRCSKSMQMYRIGVYHTTARLISHNISNPSQIFIYNLSFYKLVTIYIKWVLKSVEISSLVSLHSIGSRKSDLWFAQAHAVFMGFSLPLLSLSPPLSFSHMHSIHNNCTELVCRIESWMFYESPGLQQCKKAKQIIQAGSHKLFMFCHTPL